MAHLNDPFQDDEDSSSSFQPLVRKLWSYRRTMVLSFMLVTVVAIGALLVAFLLSPKERVGTIGFRLTFEGADQDQFPNGTKFSPSEIAGTPVLSEVYRMNELSRYLPFDNFKESMFVLQSNPNLDLLGAEYQGKLSDPKLTPVDRSRIEEEFRKKRESLRSAQYSLNFVRNERSVLLPAPVISKVLSDTLTTWAQQAVTFKGAVRHDKPLLSKNILRKEFFAAEDYVIAVDILRSKTERVLMNIDDYSQIPGSASVRIGEEQLSLAEIRAKLEDVLRFKIEPLFGQIRTASISRDPAAIERYFEGRLFQLQLEKEEAAQRVRSVQDALQSYLQKRGTTAAEGGTLQGPATTPVMPQLSESFLDRLLEMSQQSDDLTFRQDLTRRIIAESDHLAQLTRQAQYYEVMRKSFAGGRTAASPAVAADVRAATDRAYDEVVKGLDQVGALYARIAEQHLNPSGVLYSVTAPSSVRTISSFPLNTAIRYLAAALFIGLFLIPIACLAHAYFRDSVSTHSTPSRREKEPKHLTGV